MGISRKVHTIPFDINVGDWIYLGFRECIPTGEFRGPGREMMAPGIFHAYQLGAIEKLLTESQQKDQYYVKTLLDRGITPVVEVGSEKDIPYTRERLYTDLTQFIDGIVPTPGTERV